MEIVEDIFCKVRLPPRLRRVLIHIEDKSTFCNSSSSSSSISSSFFLVVPLQIGPSNCCPGLISDHPAATYSSHKSGIITMRLNAWFVFEMGVLTKFCPKLPQTTILPVYLSFFYQKLPLWSWNYSNSYQISI